MAHGSVYLFCALSRIAEIFAGAYLTIGLEDCHFPTIKYDVFTHGLVQTGESIVVPQGHVEIFEWEPARNFTSQLIVVHNDTVEATVAYGFKAYWYRPNKTVVAKIDTS